MPTPAIDTAQVSTAVQNGDVLTANIWNAVIADLETLFASREDLKARQQQQEVFTLMTLKL